MDWGLKISRELYLRFVLRKYAGQDNTKENREKIMEEIMFKLVFTPPQLWSGT